MPANPQVTDEMLRLAMAAYNTECCGFTANAPALRLAITAAVASMWKRGDDMYSLDGEVIGFWKSNEPDLAGEYGITKFNGDFWINTEDHDDPFRTPDAVMPLPAAPLPQKEG